MCRQDEVAEKIKYIDSVGKWRKYGGWGKHTQTG